LAKKGLCANVLGSSGFSCPPELWCLSIWDMNCDKILFNYRWKYYSTDLYYLSL